MTYQVVILKRAAQDLDDAYRWAAAHAPETAARWLSQFQAALGSLAQNPGRCPPAREKPRTDLDLREFLFGRHLNVFRVVFVAEGSTVRILRIRRAQRRPLSRREIEESNDPSP